jgi:hypothetical protein
VDSFIHINLQHRVVQLYEPTGHARNGRLDYDKISRHDDFPPLTTYDWSPANSGLLAVGTGTGIVNLLRIDDSSNAFVELGLKMARTCHAVAFNTTGLLAVGLDRVRMDQSLQIWDVNSLSSLRGPQVRGIPSDLRSFTDPKYRLEPSVSISSIRFFEDSPQTLVAGIKAQGLRIHDLRGMAFLCADGVLALAKSYRSIWCHSLPDKVQQQSCNRLLRSKLFRFIGTRSSRCDDLG